MMRRQRPGILWGRVTFNFKVRFSYCIFAYYIVAQRRVTFLFSKTFIMSAITYHIRIKKNYAAAIIKDLQKLDAVELLKEAPIPD